MKVAQLFIPKPRPENATQIATRIFRSEKAICTSCAQCCKGTKSIGIHSKEPEYEGLLALAREHGATATTALDGTALVFPDDTCVFLHEIPGAGITTLQICEIHKKPIKPWVCTIFPFIMKDLATADGTVRTVVALTASCPPVAELVAAGINWLEPRECVTYEEREFKKGVTYFVPVSHIPLLGDALWPLIKFGNDGHSILVLMSGKSEINGYFLKDRDGRSIIPIIENSPLRKPIDF
ncbi:MAG: YkgJ family cysteine cluster protein [Candidatus Micrarchaeota archaeon]